MRKGGGKEKGSAYEREICEKLSLFISRGKRDDLYWRSAMSGGRNTVKLKKGKQNLSQSCDITSIDSEGESLTNKYVIECKNYKDLNLLSLIFGVPKKDSIIDFWNETCVKAKQIGKLPIVIARQNFKPDLIFLPFKLRLDHCFVDQKFLEKKIYCYKLSEFLIQIKPEVIL